MSPLIGLLLYAVVGAAAGWVIGRVYVDWFQIPLMDWTALAVGFVTGGVAGRFAPRPGMAMLALAAIAMAGGWFAGDRPLDLWLELELRGAVGEGSVSMNAVGRDGLDEMHSTVGTLRAIDDRTLSAKLPFATAKDGPRVHVRVGRVYVAGFRLALTREEDWSVWTEGAGGYAYRYRVRKLEP